MDAVWSYKSNALPRADNQIMIGEWDDQIFLLSGLNYPRQVVKFNTLTNTPNDYGEWILDNTLFSFTGFDGYYWAQISNLLYALKRVSDSATPNIYVFDLSSSNFYEPRIIYTPSPYNMRDACLAAKDEYPYLYLTGGRDSSSATAQKNYFQVYDINNDIWLNMPSMQKARSHQSCVIDDNGYLYVIGGWDGSSYIASIERIQISSIDDLKDGTVDWEYIEGLPVATSVTDSVNCDGSIYILGGSIGGASDQMSIIDINTGYVSESTNMPYESSHGSAICVDCTIYYFGGWNGYLRAAWSKYEIPTCTIGMFYFVIYPYDIWIIDNYT